MKQVIKSILIILLIFILPIIFSSQLENVWMNWRESLFFKIKEATINDQDTFSLRFIKLLADKYFGFSLSCVLSFFAFLFGYLSNLGSVLAAFGLMKATK